MFIAADKCEKEATELPLIKALKVKLKLSRIQKTRMGEWMNTCRYVYNKTINCIHDNQPANFQALRDKLVTTNTKKTHPEYQEINRIISSLKIHKKSLNVKTQNDEIKATNDKMESEKKRLRDTAKKLLYQKNSTINEWEINTPKESRAGVVNDACNAHKTAMANLKAGNIKRFNLSFKKKTNPNQCVVIAKSMIKNHYGVLHIAPKALNENCHFRMGKRTIKKYKNLVIDSDCRLVKQHDEYWILIPIPVEKKEKIQPVNYCGVDPGVRSLLTSFGNKGCVEYEHDKNAIKKLNETIDRLKSKQQVKSKTIRKRDIRKREKRKQNLINEIHWKTILHLLHENDLIFFGDIKSHNITKNGKNRLLNRNMNDLCFYKYKQRLSFKAKEWNKKVIFVNEAFTTKTCSFCGKTNEPGKLKTYSCNVCDKTIGRDINASKNILMKGMIQYLSVS
jgi:putative transposase